MKDTPQKPQSEGWQSAAQAVQQEQRKVWRQQGNEQGAERAQEETDKPSYTLLLPPPNITGQLHIGHALNATLQDVLARFKRMQGFHVVWQVGFDHAGIATQIVVEKQLAAKGIHNPRSLDEDTLLKHVFEWKDACTTRMIEQLESLGASCSFARARFTMDEPFKNLVRHVFITLFEQGFIYRAKRLVNWDPLMQTAISDLEVISQDTKGALYYIRYPFAQDPSRFIVVATTRPETLFGDQAVAVHPDDERYAQDVGAQLRLPLTNRTIPIIADEHAKKEHGTGAVKITPAHDFNDFEVGKRHNLACLNIFDNTAHYNNKVPEAFQGLDRDTARVRIVEILEQEGLLEKMEAITHAVPHAERSKERIEPLLTTQWFLDAPALSKKAVEYVERGDVAFTPNATKKAYFDWMDRLEPWCISRQLWWGHAIPAWHHKESGHFFVANTQEAAAQQARKHFGKDVPLEKDSDVLDTWFSSALWSFGALDDACALDAHGLLKKTSILARHYPIQTLVTGFDILFFWVSRMLMMGVHFTQRVPFEKIYVHGLVRDEKGQKMSKSKGNVTDPLDLAQTYGVDALRFALLSATTPGQTIRLTSSKLTSARNFMTKLWNTARFCTLNHAIYTDTPQKIPLHFINRWILGRAIVCHQKIMDLMDGLRLHEACDCLYHFLWDEFCDWYVELAKHLLTQDNVSLKQETQETLGFVFRHTLFFLSPLCPFICDAILQKNDWMRPAHEVSLNAAPWPTFSKQQEALVHDQESILTTNILQNFISSTRSMKSMFSLQVTHDLGFFIEQPSPSTRTPLPLRILKENVSILAAMMRTQEPIFLKSVDFARKQDVCRFSVQGFMCALELRGVDIIEEKKRLNHTIEKLKIECDKLREILENQAFLDKAKDNVIEERKQQLHDKETECAHLASVTESLAHITQDGKL